MSGPWWPENETCVAELHFEHRCTKLIHSPVVNHLLFILIEEIIENLVYLTSVLLYLGGRTFPHYLPGMIPGSVENVINIVMFVINKKAPVVRLR